VRWPIVLCVIAALPFALVAWGATLAADRAAGLVGASLAGIGELAQKKLEPEAEPFPWDEFELAAVDAVSGDAPLSAAFELAAKDGKRGAKASPKGIRISAETVLRLADSGARPRGIPVKAEGQRPAGILLVGVSALGVGMKDGDVLVEAAGKPALQTAEVIRAVIAARAAHAKEVSGRFWRGGEYWLLVVEQPYPQALPAPSAPKKPAG